MEDWSIFLSRYPISVIEEKGRSVWIEETFSEAVSAYWMGEYDSIDTDTTDLLDVLFKF